MKGKSYIISQQLKKKFSDLDRGEIAQLRRPTSALCRNIPFWHVMLKIISKEEQERELQDSKRMVKWETLLRCWAYLHDRFDHSISLGKALLQADISETRFLRFLRASELQRCNELEKIVRFIAAKGNSDIDLGDCWNYLFLDGERREAFFLRVCRNYFS